MGDLFEDLGFSGGDQVDYTATATGWALRGVCCEECGHKYVYLLKRMARGGASGVEGRELAARDKSLARARASVNKMLKKDVNVVPCPKCGWVQKKMVPRAKQLYLRWLVWLGGALIALSALLLYLWVVSSAMGGTFRPAETTQVLIMVSLALAGLGCIAAKFLLSAIHNPNATPVEKRIQLGRSRALKRKRLERLMEMMPGAGGIADGD